MGKKINVFQVNRKDMNVDYEFIDNFEMPIEKNCLEDDYIDPNNLVFEMVDKDMCFEVSNGYKFYKVDENHYYNENTGLFFDINRIINIGINPFFDKLAFPLYESYATVFLNDMCNIKNKDDEIKNKYCALLLKNNKKYTKEED